MTKEEFNKQVNVGDIVTLWGVDRKIVPCVVMNKTEYACNLLTVEQVEGDDGVIHPWASYYRSYEEIIKRIAEARGLYNYYKQLHDEIYEKAEKDEEYKQWIDKNYKFIRRFIRDCLRIDIEDVHNDYYIATINISEPKELQ